MVLPIFQSKKIRRSRYKSSYGSAPRKASLLASTLIYLSLLVCGWIWFVLLTEGQFTIGGVPVPIIRSFFQDETARNAYFAGDNKKLHARLQAMGVEEKIKSFYRPKIRDEAKLDQYIHQILYDRTGYVGEAYQVNSEGVLVLKKRK